MSDVTKLISTFVESVAALMALVLMLSLVHRGGRESLLNKVIMGGLFSVVIVLSMIDPIQLPDGAGIFDMRGLLVGTGTAFLGPVVGGIAALTAFSFRILIGPPALLAGLFGVAISFAMGLLWHVFIKELRMVTWKKSLILGVMLSSQMLGIFFGPQMYYQHLFINLAPYIVVSSLLGALILNHLLSGELSFLSEAEASKIDANTDHLTGLLNRRGLELIYPKMIENNGRTAGQALLYFDVDRFKGTNDTYGHAVGDDVLRHVVDQVAANLRKKDTFVRLGGDEFVVVLPDIDAAEAEAISERCRSVVAKAGFEHDHEVLAVSISVGAVWAKKPTRIDALLNFADEALYRAKENGRNCVVFIRNESAGLTIAA